MSNILLNLADLVSNAAASYLTTNAHLFQGETGAKGDTGTTGAATYVWVMYADNGTGSGISSSPVGKPYLGLAFNKGSSTPSNDSSDYYWSYIKGQDGADGNTGATGATGAQGTSVHHIKGTSTSDLEGDFSTPGEVDTYTLYGDADETINLGHFNVVNGSRGPIGETGLVPKLGLAYSNGSLIMTIEGYEEASEQVEWSAG